MRTITRARLKRLIEAGIEAGQRCGLTDENAAKLRVVGETATTVAAGTSSMPVGDSLCQCPLSQAGLWDGEEALEGYWGGCRAFYVAFDSYVQETPTAMEVIG